MKKITKISLVAALAVAGLTTANAKPLAEAIKDVEVSGSVVYRYNDYKNDVTDSHSSNNNYKVGLNLSSKVNDDIKVNTRFIVGGEALGFASLNTSTEGDASVNVTLSEVYFSYTGLKNTVIGVGKHGLHTPWTIGQSADGDEQTATGVNMKTTWAGITFVAAYDNQTNLDKSGVLAGQVNGSNDIMAFALIANAGPVALDAWYADVSDIGTTYTVGAATNLDLDAVDLGISARYTGVDVDTDFATTKGMTEENSAFKLGLTAKMGIFDASYDYTMTDKDGGLTGVDSTAITVYDGWGMNTNMKADADLHHFGVGVQATDTIHVALNYTMLDWDSTLIDPTGNGLVGDVEEEEIYTQFTHNLSKNMSYYIRFGTYTLEDSVKEVVDSDYRGRLQVKYTF